jgi:hypothetical protein
MARDTLARWNETDWGVNPQVFVDAEAEIPGQEWGTVGRHARLAKMVRGALHRARLGAIYGRFHSYGGGKRLRHA